MPIPTSTATIRPAIGTPRARRATFADVFVTHAFNEGLSGSLGFNYAGGMEWLAGGTWVPPTRHLDLRLVQTLRFGGRPGRIGLNVDNLLGAQRTYQDTNTICRRLFLMLVLPF